jgi:hypothetical protein
MITFVITKSDISKNLECCLEDNILKLKNDIIKEFNLTCPYVDIDFQLERPIRSLGKFNLESGILPRTLDSYTFDRYGLDGRTVNATFHEVIDYDNKKYSKSFQHVNLSQKYKVGANRRTVEDSIFDITSETDFPKLG